ncbi:L-lactate dehydrogenase [Aquisediminimonas sediminicola]|uniref:L-lactate dehydrogenase n=1 Tax=Alteraquisediminimonas sediminicola TaxID=2676787 RepID=UPI001C8E6AB7|nr:L-lactate dehydrogenase [Aquisediminimonas sediminicola]
MTALPSYVDFRDVARRRLPHFLFEYYDGAAFDGRTAEANVRDFSLLPMEQRVLCDVGGVSTATSLLGEACALPLAFSPIGLAGMAWRRGEVAAAAAAQAKGVPFSLSTTSVCDMAEVADIAPPWFQLYMMRDRAFMADMIDRAQAQGCRTLLLTVDLPVLGTRWRDARSGLNQRGIGGAIWRARQIAMRPGWALSVGLGGKPHTLGNISHGLGGGKSLAACMAYTSSSLETNLSPATIEWVRSLWCGNLLVKGVLRESDALAALSAGADGIVISNHGGRQLDGVPSTASVLERISRAVTGRGVVLVDSGIRTGLDVYRALARGADAVMVGRPWLFALAAAGRVGVEKMVDNLQADLRIAMALSGTRSIAEIRMQGGFPAI